MDSESLPGFVRFLTSRGALPPGLYGRRAMDSVYSDSGRGWELTRSEKLSIITRFAGGVPERSKGTDCKSVGSAFEGSNPSPSTKVLQREMVGVVGVSRAVRV